MDRLSSPVADSARLDQIHTHGSYIEEKGTAVLWHYGNAEPEFGGMQASEATRKPINPSFRLLSRLFLMQTLIFSSYLMYVLVPGILPSLLMHSIYFYHVVRVYDL